MSPSRPDPRGPAGTITDRVLIERVLAGDEEAFASLVARHQASLLRIARAVVPSRPLAEDLVQDCWIVALEKLESFEGRSELRTWLIGIILKRARSVAARDRSHRSGLEEADVPAIPRERLSASGRSWSHPPARWAPDLPDAVLRQKEARSAFLDALERLPESQRAVVTLRDVEGLSSEEVCAALSLSAANQRVLLHRGRARLRNLLEGYADGNI